jgi:hypothetical protein
MRRNAMKGYDMKRQKIEQGQPVEVSLTLMEKQ